MNLSGPPLARHLKTSNVPVDRLVVLHDDLDRPPLRTSPKLGGSANGHNGVRSIISSLGQNGFQRLRLGIGRTDEDVYSYVLGSLSAEERAHWGDGGRGISDAWTVIEKIIAEHRHL
jgi:peptidyl-tRNA hydrolase, PTH1 family